MIYSQPNHLPGFPIFRVALHVRTILTAVKAPRFLKQGNDGTVVTDVTKTITEVKCRLDEYEVGLRSTVALIPHHGLFSRWAT